MHLRVYVGDDSQFPLDARAFGPVAALGVAYWGLRILGCCGFALIQTSPNHAITVHLDAQELHVR
jgi:hypothetical protein